MPYVEKQYTHFQFIAYETPTYQVYSANPDVGETAEAPVPVLDGLSLDAACRLKRFAKVMDFARQSVNVDADANTLKIFVAPEFYFRPNAGVNNSYTMNEGTSVNHALRRMFINNVWEHWIIVPGTTFWMQKTPHEGGNVYWTLHS